MTPTPLHSPPMRSQHRQMTDLCERCQRFDIQSLADRAYPWRGYRTHDVQISAESGCLFCATLIQELLPAESRSERKKTGDWIHFRALRREWTTSDNAIERGPGPSEQRATGLNITRLIAKVAVHSIEGNVSSPKVEFHVVADEADPATVSGDIVGGYTERDAGSSHQTVASIKSWIDECRHHYDCSRTFSGSEKLDAAGSPLPTRCIYVSKTDDGSLKFELQHTAGKISQYVTLSHRWTAETGTVSTTQANMADRLRGIGLDNLPPLFTDVFTLVANLDIPYVWIDSLCIIQNDASDWSIEAVRMGEYYQRSAFTLACSDAQPNTLFNKTEPSNIRAPLIQMPYRDPSGKQQGYFYLHKQNIMERYENAVAKSELLTRGWVFQEWILSRRIICYTSSGLFFLCQSRSPRTEIGQLIKPELLLLQPLSSDEYSGDKHAAEKYSLKNSLVDHSLSVSSRRDVDKETHADWEHLVEAYSGLRLTCPSKDRLIAMSGIADEFARALRKRYASIGQTEDDGDVLTTPIRTYVAGLWLSSIRRGLLWEQVQKGTHERIPTIPTWSWASISTQVWWNKPKVEWWGEPVYKTICDFELDRVLHHTFEEYQAGLIDTNPTKPTVDGPLEILPRNNDSRGVRDNPYARFPILCLRAKLQPVILGGYFISDQDVQVTAQLVSHKSLPRTKNWRMVASPLKRDHIAGCASIEHPDFQPPNQQADSVVVDKGQPILYALHISTFGGGRGGMTLSYLSLSHRVFSVLFVRPVQTIVNGYERVGVGRLFGKEIDRGFEDAVMREVRLV
ncbi:heterokaryon incompatibility protein-domain-containing protein [Lasiosphaeria hispida]|uniref:Heterokaryon incompatibility protein-domain-containing protein n=1 Tax=Lasiosphaeria hispida TaxID=260671 RepID=A0AAJ0HJ78_9PEZI|nr:heterokaryon incompatibility protein-domain-containing protein [Lasiosphaeria hispida]